MGNDRRSRVVIDTEKNRLSISLTGSIDREEIEKIYSDLLVGLAEMKPGFDVVTDLSRCRLAHLDGLPVFRKITETLLEHRVGKVVRIVGAGKLIFNQISRVTRHIQGYEAIYVSTLQEAQELLKMPSK